MAKPKATFASPFPHPSPPVSWPQVGLQLICVCRPDARLISSRGAFEQWHIFDWEIEILMRELLQNCDKRVRIVTLKISVKARRKDTV
jgi:hypothetical protein